MKNVSPLTHRLTTHYIITKLHFPVLWLILKEKRKTTMRDKMISGHMDKDNKNLTYYRVFKIRK